MLYLTEDIPARTRIRAEILYNLGYLTQSMIDSLSRDQLISFVNTMRFAVNSEYGVKSRN